MVSDAESGRGRKKWFRRSPKSDRSNLDGPPEERGIELPPDGIQQMEMVTPDGQNYPYMMVGLKDLKAFDREVFRRVFDAIVGWDGHDDSQKYLVISQQSNGDTRDGLFVFPGEVRHDRFYEHLQTAGHKGGSNLLDLYLIL